MGKGLMYLSNTEEYADSGVHVGSFHGLLTSLSLSSLSLTLLALGLRSVTK